MLPILSQNVVENEMPDNFVTHGIEAHNLSAIFVSPATVSPRSSFAMAQLRLKEAHDHELLSTSDDRGRFCSRLSLPGTDSFK
jgi:hypothetical protein